MADSGGTKAKAFAGGIASPGIGIIKSWQGIVEIILRAVIMVSQCAVFTSTYMCAGIVYLLK